MTTERTESVLGPVPDAWTTRRLEEVSDFITKGGTPTTYGFDWASQKDGIPFFRSECVTDNGFNPKGMNYIHAQAHQQMSRSEIKPGDLLMTITGNIGRVAVAPSEFESANINQHIARIRILDDAGANASFVYHCLKHDRYATHYRAILTGQAYPQISLQQVRETPVALPPLPEQQKIAAILTAVDDKLDVIARQIEATQTLKQGLMQTLFSRGVGTQDADGCWVPHAMFKDSELGDIPVGWTLMPLEELAVENITYGVVQPGESVEGGIPLVRGGDIKSGRIAANLRTVSTEISNQFKRTILKGGEVLVSLVGYPGETAVVPSQLAGANIARQAGMIRTGCVTTSEFIHYYLSSPVGKSFLLAGMIGSAQQVINLKALREVLIPLPPVEERERICSICSAVTKKLQALEDKQSSFQDLKRGLMQKLLTGEWRVNVDASATET